MSALLKPLDNRLFWPAVAIGGLLILAFVLYLQHVRGFAPCSLCIFIRLDVLGLVLAGIVGSLAPRSRIAGGIAALGMLAASLG
ncbi:disulfide bond formation protein B, partial [Pseudomonas aeruginosa]